MKIRIAKVISERVGYDTVHRTLVTVGVGDANEILSPFHNKTWAELLTDWLTDEHMNWRLRTYGDASVSYRGYTIFRL